MPWSFLRTTKRSATGNGNGGGGGGGGAAARKAAEETSTFAPLPRGSSKSELAWADNNLETQLRTALNELESTRAHRDALQDDLSTARKEVEDMKQQLLASMSETKKALKTQLAQVRAEVAALKEQVKSSASLSPEAAAAAIAAAKVEGETSAAAASSGAGVGGGGAGLVAARGSVLKKPKKPKKGLKFAAGDDLCFVKEYLLPIAFVGSKEYEDASGRLHRGSSMVEGSFDASSSSSSSSSDDAIVDDTRASQSATMQMFQGKELAKLIHGQKQRRSSKISDTPLEAQPPQPPEGASSQQLPADAAAAGSSVSGATGAAGGGGGGGGSERGGGGGAEVTAGALVPAESSLPLSNEISRNSSSLRRREPFSVPYVLKKSDSYPLEAWVSERGSWGINQIMDAQLLVCPSFCLSFFFLRFINSFPSSFPCPPPPPTGIVVRESRHHQRPRRHAATSAAQGRSDGQSAAPDDARGSHFRAADGVDGAGCDGGGRDRIPHHHAQATLLGLPPATGAEGGKGAALLRDGHGAVPPRRARRAHRRRGE